MIVRFTLKVISFIEDSVQRCSGLIMLVLCTLGASSSTLAGGNHHMHADGVANLKLTYENGVMQVLFESPMITLLGFEHDAKTPQQKEILRETKLFLKASDNVLSVKGANCSSSTANVSIGGPVGSLTTDNELTNDQPSDRQRLSDRGDEASKNQPITRESPDSVKERHSEISASYEFDCIRDETPKSFTINIFDRFPTLTKVNVRWVVKTREGVSTLRRESATIKLR